MAQPRAGKTGHAGLRQHAVDVALVLRGRSARERERGLRDLRIRDVMHADPITIRPETLAAEAVRLMEESRITQLLVADASGRLVGALHFHDLLDAKVV